jgi:hypothetical protein
VVNERVGVGVCGRRKEMAMTKFTKILILLLTAAIIFVTILLIQTNSKDKLSGADSVQDEITITVFSEKNKFGITDQYNNILIPAIFDKFIEENDFLIGIEGTEYAFFDKNGKALLPFTVDGYKDNYCYKDNVNFYFEDGVFGKINIKQEIYGTELSFDITDNAVNYQDYLTMTHVLDQAVRCLFKQEYFIEGIANTLEFTTQIEDDGNVSESGLLLRSVVKNGYINKNDFSVSCDIKSTEKNYNFKIYFTKNADGSLNANLEGAKKDVKSSSFNGK